MNKKKYMIVANDLGYGEVKANIDDEYIQQPSVVAEIHQVTGDPISDPTESQIKQTVGSLLDNMDVTIDNKRYLVGISASNSTLPRKAFDVNSGFGKSETELSLILPLSLIAAKKVQEAYEAGDDIFEPLKADVVMATALPINEFGRNAAAKRESYTKKFTGKKHIVILNNFADPISVTISFKDVQIFKEGEIATAIAIKKGNIKELESALKADIKKYSPDYADDADSLIKDSKNVLGIDIGQGTTDLALTSNGKADPFTSTSINQGYGTILSNALDQIPIMENGYNLPDVVALTDILNSDPTSSIKKENKQTALQAVEDNVDSLVNDIEQKLNTILSKNTQLEVVYIFGGGSIPLIKMTNLRDNLTRNLRRKRSDAVVVWVGKDYAQRLNEIGLDLLVNAMAARFN